MPDEPTNDPRDTGDGKPLPQREMMSLVSTDPVPVDTMYSTMVPVDQAEGPPLATLPVEGPDADAGSDEVDRSETFAASDSASAS